MAADPQQADRSYYGQRTLSGEAGGEVSHDYLEQRRGGADAERAPTEVADEEIKACRPWLEAEFETLEPAIVVCLGATAAQALFGSKFRLTQQRGQPLPSPYCDWTFATYHPSAVLRARQADYDGEIEAGFMEDMRTIARFYKKLHKGRR